jgi:hypothetical protein
MAAGLGEAHATISHVPRRVAPLKVGHLALSAAKLGTTGLQACYFAN